MPCFVDTGSHPRSRLPEPTLAPCTYEVGSGLRSAMAATCAAPPECKLSINDGCNDGSWVHDAAKIASSVNDEVPAENSYARKVHLKDGDRPRNSFLEPVAPAPWPQNCNNRPQGAGQGLSTWSTGESAATLGAPPAKAWLASSLWGTVEDGAWSTSASMLMNTPPPVDTFSNSLKNHQKLALYCGNLEVGSRLRSSAAATCAKPPECQLTFEDNCDFAGHRPPTWAKNSCGLGSRAGDEGQLDTDFANKVSDLLGSWTVADECQFTPSLRAHQQQPHQAEIESMQLPQCLEAFSPFIRRHTDATTQVAEPCGKFID